MKNLTRIFFLLLTTIVLAGNQTVFTDLSLNEAQILSKKDGKPLLIKFHADWCHNCTKMDRTTFKDSKVVLELENYISVKIDVDTALGQKTAKAFGISAIPVIVILNDEGDEILRKVGYQTPKVLASKLSQLSME